MITAVIVGPKEHAGPAPGGTDTGESRRRFYELDLLRFVAAAAVVSFHYFFRAGAQLPVMAHTGFSDPAHVFRYGNLGVAAGRLRIPASRRLF